MSKKTGGPAFPGDVSTRYPRSMLYGDLATGSEVVTQSHQGMTLRDYFAAKAMQALLSGPDRDRVFIAHAAYRYANAMIAERDSERRT